MAAHEVGAAAVEPELFAGVAGAGLLEQVDGVGLGGLRGRRDVDRDVEARLVEARQLAAEPRDLAVGEDSRQAILGLDLLVEDRPHLAVVPDVRLAVAGVDVGEEATERSAVEQPVGAVQPVVVLGEQEERSVVRRLDDHARAVVERQPVDAVGRHHRRQLADVDDRPRIAVVAPGRRHHCAMPGVGRVHTPSLPYALRSLPDDGDALGDGVGIGGGRDPGPPGGHERRRHTHVGRLRQRGGADRGRPQRRRPRAAGQGRAVPLQRQRVPRGAVRRRSRCAASRSTSTTATSTRSCGTCSTTPTPRRSFFHASLADRVGACRRSAAEAEAAGRGRRHRCTAICSAVAPSNTRRSSPPTTRRTRITRDENDLYMLYTGGTTGMPKGVMYPIGDITRFFTPARVRRRRPARHRAVADEIAPAVADARSRRPHVGERHRRAADARHRAVARRADASPRRRSRRHADQPQPRCRRVAARRSSAIAARTTRSSATRSRSRSSAPSTPPSSAASRTTCRRCGMIVSSGVMWTD